MLFHVIHATRYSYESPVSHSLNEIRLTPRALAAQEVRRNDIRVEPEPAFMYARKDYYGNDVNSFELLEKHDRLHITAESIVNVGSPSLERQSTISWKDAQTAIVSQTDDASIEASEFIYNSPHVSVTPQLAEYAAPSFVAGKSLIEALEDLTHRIHQDFKYKPQSTSISTPLTEVMRHRRGVCQDFAHVMIGRLRS